MVPSARIANAGMVSRARACVASICRQVRTSLPAQVIALTLAMGVAQTVALCAAYGAIPRGGAAVVVVMLLAILAGLWIGTYVFIRLVTARSGQIAALATALVFYGAITRMVSLGMVAAWIGLVPIAAVAALILPRMAWPEEPQRPTLPTA
jgi:hypothetical protein